MPMRLSGDARAVVARHGRRSGRPSTGVSPARLALTQSLRRDRLERQRIGGLGPGRERNQRAHGGLVRRIAEVDRDRPAARRRLRRRRRRPAVASKLSPTNGRRCAAPLPRCGRAARRQWRPTGARSSGIAISLSPSIHRVVIHSGWRDVIHKRCHMPSTRFSHRLFHKVRTGIVHRRSARPPACVELRQPAHWFRRPCLRRLAPRIVGGGIRAGRILMMKKPRCCSRCSAALPRAVARGARRPRPSRWRISTAARPSPWWSAPRRAATTTCACAWSRAISASTSRAIRPSSPPTCRAPARCWSPTGSPTWRRKDGTVIVALSQNLAVHQATGAAGVKFDVREFNWIGNTTDTPNVINSWHTTGIKHHPGRDAARAGGRRDRHRQRLLSSIRTRSTSWSAPSSRSSPAIPAATTSISRWSAARSAAAARTPGRRGSRRGRNGSRRRRSSSWSRSA